MRFGRRPRMSVGMLSAVTALTTAGILAVSALALPASAQTSGPATHGRGQGPADRSRQQQNAEGSRSCQCEVESPERSS